ncbi:MAG TPA: DNA recombination protein RmuC, partial [Pseudomonas sp.]|nr:DNA recombination protein RmuC [Pseudomonas sp.]
MPFTLDLSNLLLGLLLGAVPLAALAWQLQRKLALHSGERLLLEERLSSARLAQEGLSAQLDSSLDELRELQQNSAAQQAELAALRREAELLGVEREGAREAAQSWSRERELKEGELRRLESERAGLAAELR